MTESEYKWGLMRGWFGPESLPEQGQAGRRGRGLGGAGGSRLWPGARVPYQLADTIDFTEWRTLQLVFSNVSSVTNIQFVPR